MGVVLVPLGATVGAVIAALLPDGGSLPRRLLVLAGASCFLLALWQLFAHITGLPRLL